MSPAQAYGINMKMDDGLPLTGNVIEMRLPSNGTLDGAPETLAGQCITTVAANAYYTSNYAALCRLLVHAQ